MTNTQVSTPFSTARDEQLARQMSHTINHKIAVKLARVAMLHHPDIDTLTDEPERCVECLKRWPCPTLHTIDETVADA